MMIDFYNEGDYTETITLQKIKKTIQHAFDYPEKLSIYLFLVNQQLVGYSIIVYYWSNEYGGNIITFDEIYTNSAFRQQGIASKFIDFISFQENIVGLQLEVEPSNHKAMAFYKKLGFEFDRNQHFFKKLTNF